MTFANRDQGGSGVYARSLLASVAARHQIASWVIAGPSKSTPAGTLDWLLRKARRQIAARPPDVLHCPSFVAPWGIRVPTVVTVHDAAVNRFPSDHPLEWRFYVRSLMPGRLRAAARVITGSEFSRHEVIAANRLDPGRVTVVPYGLDASFLNHHPTTSQPDGTGALLFPGAPIGRKNLDAVLRCLAEAQPGSALARISLDISGAREERFPAYSVLVRDLGLQARVRWLGRVPSEELPTLFARAAAVVYPSLYEGFGFPPLEAMAVGTPVVASDRGSLPEVLGDGALLVDPTDRRALGQALEAVLSRPEVRERLRTAGTKRARLYTWDKCAERTIDVYRDVRAGAPLAS